MTKERDFFCFFEETCNIIGKTCSIIGKHISQRRNLLLSKFFGSAPTLLQPCSSLLGWRGVGEELERDWRGSGEEQVESWGEKRHPFFDVSVAKARQNRTFKKPRGISFTENTPRNYELKYVKSCREL